MIVVVLLGVLLGPLVNLLIDRLPLRQSLLAWPSCRTCGATRTWIWLLPFISLWLGRGRCSGCQGSRSRREMAVNVGLPLAAAALWLRDGGNPMVYLQLVLAAYFIAIVAIDLEHRLVLNRMTGAGIIAAYAIAAAGQGPSLRSALLGTVIGFLFLWIPALLVSGLGMGDVKLAAVIGALVGFPSVLTALTLGVLVGGVAAGVLLLSRRIDRRGTIAYAPYLVVGVALVLLRAA